MWWAAFSPPPSHSRPPELLPRVHDRTDPVCVSAMGVCLPTHRPMCHRAVCPPPPRIPWLFSHTDFSCKTGVRFCRTKINPAGVSAGIGLNVSHLGAAAPITPEEPWSLHVSCSGRAKVSHAFSGCCKRAFFYYDFKCLLPQRRPQCSQAASRFPALRNSRLFLSFLPFSREYFR